jgi:hypothetical protein
MNRLEDQATRTLHPAGAGGNQRPALSASFDVAQVFDVLTHLATAVAPGATVLVWLAEEGTLVCHHAPVPEVGEPELSLLDNPGPAASAARLQRTVRAARPWPALAVPLVFGRRTVGVFELRGPEAALAGPAATAALESAAILAAAAIEAGHRHDQELARLEREQ